MDRKRAARRRRSQERRESHRLPVDVLVNRFIDGYPYLCRATDISRSGMRVVPFIEPRHGPAQGPRSLGLQFQLPGTEEVLTASGETVFAQDDRGAVGIRFTLLPSGTAACLDRFMASRA
jgi:PilZ domain